MVWSPVKLVRCEVLVFWGAGSHLASRTGSLVQIQTNPSRQGSRLIPVTLPADRFLGCVVAIQCEDYSQKQHDVTQEHPGTAHQVCGEVADQPGAELTNYAQECVTTAIWLWFGQNRFGIPFWLVGKFTHFGTYFSGWIGMFTENTIGILTHGNMGVLR